MIEEKRIYEPTNMVPSEQYKTFFALGVVSRKHGKQIRVTICDKWAQIDSDMATDALFALAAALGYAVVDKNILENIEGRMCRAERLLGV